MFNKVWNKNGKSKDQTKKMETSLIFFFIKVQKKIFALKCQGVFKRTCPLNIIKSPFDICI